jgi:hypothetical protein
MYSERERVSPGTNARLLACGGNRRDSSNNRFFTLEEQTVADCTIDVHHCSSPWLNTRDRDANAASNLLKTSSNSYTIAYCASITCASFAVRKVAIDGQGRPAAEHTPSLLVEERNQVSHLLTSANSDCAHWLAGQPAWAYCSPARGPTCVRC